MKTGLEVVLIIISYLLGSIPFGYIFTKSIAGLNIREHGSGNTGSTNVRRIAGRKVALFTQLCDMMKGLLPVSIILILQYYKFFHFDNFLIYAVALSAILGHDFSIFLNFKGGKGVNTTLGATLLLSPYSVFASVLVYFLVKWSSKYVSLGSVCLAITLTLTDVIIHKTSILFYYLLICSILIVIMHIPNIKRLVQGTERRSK
jgi:glycerol-3-phosphate acyltransferase PlsY